MQTKIQIIQHRGKNIVYSDYSGLEGSEFVDVIMTHHRQHRAMIDRCQTDILFLTNVDECQACAEVLTAFKQTVKENQPYIEKSAVVGVVGTQRVALNAINFFSSTESKVFSSVDDAVEWLAD